MAHDFRALTRLLILQLHDAASLRVSFVVQILGMMLNNAGIAVMWVLFISVFGTVNGWGAADVLGAQGIGSLTFGLGYTFCYGAVNFSLAIRRGTFDGFLLRPLRILPHVWRSTFAASTIGDILFGLVMIAIATVLSDSPWTVPAVALLLAPPGAMIMVAISTIMNSYAFWRPDDRMLTEIGFRMFMTPTMYPAGAFPDALRAIFTFLIPSLLVAGVPWEAARGQLAFVAIGVWVAGLAWLSLSALVFHAGLRRYESGGGIG